jgi:hypothetical protein
MRTKTDFDRDMKSGNGFWLGPVNGSHEIGDYQFIEYQEKIFSPDKNSGQLSGKSNFSCYIGGKSIGRSALTLESAMITSIAYRFDGCNTRADSYFLKMLENNPSQTKQ